MAWIGLETFVFLCFLFHFRQRSIIIIFMFERILLPLILLLCCGLHSASAGVMSSWILDQDSIIVETTGSMSGPDEPAEDSEFRLGQPELGMSATVTPNSTTGSQPAAVSAELELVKPPVIKLSRLQLANAKLPPSPILDGLLKPSWIQPSRYV